MHDWIDQPDDLAEWLDRQRPDAPLYLDTEFMRTNTFHSRLALVQVKLEGAVALLDAPKLDRAAALASRLTDARNPCVMHSASEDLDALTDILPQGPATLFDTQIAAAMAGKGFGLSYQKLVAELLGIELPKAETRSDWLQAPTQRSPARLRRPGCGPSARAARVACHKLERLGRGDWLDEDCRRLVQRICGSPPDPQPQRALRGAADWPLERQALLRRILLWRESTARRLDKPRPWILDDARALSLVAAPPDTAAELFERCKGLRALRGTQRQELFGLLHTPLGDDELDIVPIAQSLNNMQRRQVSAMRDEVARIAAELDIPEGLLCPRRHLEALVGEGAWPEALEGWRKPLLHDALMGKMD